jgi:hypothetical protein
MQIEERFGVTISDARAERIGTVGELYVFLLENARRNAPIRCPSSRAFYHIRRTLVGDLGVERARVRPAALLRDLVPAEARETAWPRLAAALDVPDLPDPDPPYRGPTAKTLRRALVTATAGVWRVNLLMPLLLGWPVVLAGLLKLWFLLWFLVVLGVTVVFGAFWLEAHGRRRLPKVRDLVLRLAARDCDRYLADDTCEPTPAAVWSDLVTLLSAHTGMPADEILPEHTFDDLS